MNDGTIKDFIHGCDEETFIGGKCISCGLTVASIPSFMDRVIGIVKAPIAIVKVIVKYVAWRLYGKRRHEDAIMRDLKKWRRNAGLLPRSDSIIDRTYFDDEQRKAARLNELLSAKPMINSGAESLHAEIIRRTVHNTGHKASMSIVDDKDTMSESDLVLPLSDSVVAPKA